MEAIKCCKLDTLLRQYIAKNDRIPFIVFLQETWLDPSRNYQFSPSPLVPEDYATLISHREDPEGQIKGRGLMIVVHPGLLQLLSPQRGPAAHLTLIDHITTPTYEFLAASLGNLYIASVYVKITNRNPDYEHLVEVLFSMRPARCQHVILGGDFNYEHLWEWCHGLFKDVGVASVITGKRKEIQRTHSKGSVLDHVLVSSGVVVDWESVNADPMPDHITDHHLITLKVTLTGSPNSNPNPNPNPNPNGDPNGEPNGGPDPNPNPSLLACPAPPPNRFPVSNLKKHMRNYRTVQLHLDRKAKRPEYKIPPQVLALKAKVDAVEAVIETEVARLLAEKPADLEALNTGLLEVGVSVFGKPKQKRRLQRSYMYKEKVRKEQKARSVWEKKLHRACQRNREQDIALASEELKKADKRWEASRRAAQREQWNDFVRIVLDGKMGAFYRMFQRVRMSKPPRTPSTHLDPDKTVGFYSSLYANPESAKIIAGSIPEYVGHEEEEKEKEKGKEEEVVGERGGVQATEKKEGGDDAPSAPEDAVPCARNPDPTLVSDREVRRACRQMKASCSGKDGVPPELLIHLSDDIATVLACMFTKCLREGLPTGLRHGLITLLPKTTPPSKDPTKYRPITLLPACVRLLLRVVDNKLRDYIKDRPTIISIPNEQGGFMPDRNTHLQAFILLLLRDSIRHQKLALFVAFLDIEKAFDTIDHVQLLEVMRKVGIPEDLVQAIHRLLPFFNLEVMGAVFPQEQGTYQGSPLSPLLCVLFLMDLILYINGDEASAFHGTKLPWLKAEDSDLLTTMLKILLFADDIAILASSSRQLQMALNLMALWAERRGLRWGHSKCKVMRLCREASDKRTREELAKQLKMRLQGHVLDWVSDFTYLGMHIAEAPYYCRHHPLTIPTKEHKIRSLCTALLKMFPTSARCTRVAPLAARLGVLQVIHAKFLYQAPLLDIDYKILDRQVNRCLRRLCGLPFCTPSVLIHADLGVWPSRYYAHQRALLFLYRLRWKYWTKDGFKTWFDNPNDAPVPPHQPPPGVVPKCLRPEWAPRGILARYSHLLEEYGLGWDHMMCEESDWKQRVSKAIQEAFEKECKDAAAKDHHNHPLLEFPHANRHPRLKHVLSMEGDLALAALRMRCPRLRLVPSYIHSDHGTCRYCGHGPENGLHLVVCPSIPSSPYDPNDPKKPLGLRERRDKIFQDISRQSGVPIVGATRHRMGAIQNYIMEFAWPNMTPALLKRLLVFCRDLINKYAAYKPKWETGMDAFPVHRVRPVYRLPSDNE